MIVSGIDAIHLDPTGSLFTSTRCASERPVILHTDRMDRTLSGSGGPRLVQATEPGHIRFPVRSHGAGWDWSLPEDLELIGTDADHAVDRGGRHRRPGPVRRRREVGSRPLRAFRRLIRLGRDRITTGWQRMSLHSIDEAPPKFDQPRPLQTGECVSSGRPPRTCVAGKIFGWCSRAVGSGQNPLTGQFPATYAALGRGGAPSAGDPIGHHALPPTLRPTQTASQP
jgi:hypothetical protein